MHKVVISDTSCLILLDKVNELDLLKKVYDEIIITKVVAEEFGKSLPEWIKLDQAKHTETEQILELEIDRGEASSIALALELKNATLILDDWRARTIANKLGLIYTGTMGVLVKAKIKGVIKSVKPIIEKIRTTDFRISEKVLNETLKESGEL